ncbi:hypothetical protein CONPUDRAFT_147171 [Coniophora puteana RWD-64-598 SS2]|uniref:Uncharacterized protein n=1 Tax=Coniophora puteana (strain RWD-64-598) TaxID=741705 RepID=A0A5M3M8Q4_CONPW|nr:uncharacterized protein CONPUDRAFT_147171 [Coniophora puteana RWD-64-598 SS2]EIW75579.1 hypothetical protein CONPUDRAFT_147171 [Coniophora puteana RWD-64-598 SS2]
MSAIPSPPANEVQQPLPTSQVSLHFDVMWHIVSIAATPDFSLLADGGSPYAELMSLCHINSTLRPAALCSLVHTLVLPTHSEVILFQETLQAQQAYNNTHRPGPKSRLWFEYSGKIHRIFMGYLPPPGPVFARSFPTTIEQAAHDRAMSKAATSVSSALFAPILLTACDVAVDETALYLVKAVNRPSSADEDDVDLTEQVRRTPPVWRMRTFSVVGPLHDLDWVRFREDVGQGFFAPTLRTRRYQGACCHVHTAAVAFGAPNLSWGGVGAPGGMEVTQYLIFPAMSERYPHTLHEHTSSSAGLARMHIGRECIAAWARDEY